MATLTGSSDNDVLQGSTADDTITGRAGDDTLMSGGGIDELFGGTGNDVIFANDEIAGGTSLVRAGDGDDVVQAYTSTGGDLQGNDGTDTLALINQRPRAILVDLDANLFTAISASFAGLTFAGFERLEVTTRGGKDTLYGGALDDVLNAGGGTNLVDAKAGDDRVSYVTSEANTLSGGDGFDTLVANSGQSSLYFIVDTFDGSVDDGSLSDISGFEVYDVTGADFDDIASLGLGDDSFLGRGGNDTGFGGDGADSLYGGLQNDSLDGGSGRDVLYGGAGDDGLIGGGDKDVLGGGAGSDIVDAGAGDDRIKFYTGQDTATGGSGADTFEFTRNQSGLHTITDFEVGVDQLHFTGLFIPGGPAAGPLDPSLLSYGAASGPAGQFVLVYSAGTDQTTLLWDQNGDDPAGGTYAMVELSGEVALTAADILIL